MSSITNTYHIFLLFLLHYYNCYIQRNTQGARKKRNTNSGKIIWRLQKENTNKTFVTVCHFLHLNFYSLISDEYYLKAANDLCTNEERISTMDECNSAVNQLKARGEFANIEVREESTTTNPKGCYLLDVIPMVYWNPPWDNLGKANAAAKPICKLSE